MDTSHEAGDDHVAHFASSIGLARPGQDDDAFWAELIAAHGPVADRIGEALADAVAEMDPGVRRMKTQAVYELKNADLDLALAVTGHYRGVLLRSVMRWLERQDGPAPRRILDLGCDIGILTCFVAGLFPEAEVFGIDSSRNAVRRASELARRAGTGNVSFDVADARTFTEAAPSGHYDLIIAVNSFEYIASFPAAGAHFAITDIALEMPDESTRTMLVGLAQILDTDTGTLVSVDQFASSRQQWWWLRAVNLAGLSIEWDRAVQLVADAGDPDPALVPLVVASRRAPHRVATLDDFLASAIYRQLEIRGASRHFTAELAESLFAAISPKTLIRGVEIVHNPQGFAPGQIPLAERHEVWEAGPFLLVYRTANDGVARELELRSKAAGRLVFSDFDERISFVERTAAVELRRYASTGERDLSGAGHAPSESAAPADPVTSTVR